jgi:hypothetical protein
MTFPFDLTQRLWSTGDYTTGTGMGARGKGSVICPLVATQNAQAPRAMPIAILRILSAPRNSRRSVAAVASTFGFDFPIHCITMNQFQVIAAALNRQRRDL